MDILAKKENIKYQSALLRQLKSDSKKSIFREYINEMPFQEVTDLKTLFYNMDLYDYDFNPADLSNIINYYKEKPLLIDFWASWCLPCIKNLGQTIDYKKKNPGLSILFISLDKSQDQWKSFLHSNLLLNSFSQYRRNYNKKDSIFNRIEVIPKYGLLNRNGSLELFDEISDSLIKNYCSQF